MAYPQVRGRNTSIRLCGGISTRILNCRRVIDRTSSKNQMGLGKRAVPFSALTAIPRPSSQDSQTRSEYTCQNHADSSRTVPLQSPTQQVLHSIQVRDHLLPDI